MPDTVKNTDYVERTKELTDKLEAGMKELFSSDKYREYLKTMSQFHNYSARNIMLIQLQRPGATLVASFDMWKKQFNRHVKKGEQGIRIYAPIGTKTPEKKLLEKLDPETGAPLLDEKGNIIMEEMTALTSGIRFKLVPVFDVGQTQGDPLPQLAEDLYGDVEHYEAFLDALKAVSPLPVVFEKMDAAQDGYCQFGKKIAIREGMSEVQTISAVVHELTHARLHAKDKAIDGEKPKPKSVREIEAESCAFVTCAKFGIETGANSFGYLTSWGSHDLKEFKASLDTIRKESSGLISAIEGHFKAICKERGIDLTHKEQESGVSAPAKTPAPEYTTETRKETIAGVEFEFQDIIPGGTEPVNTAAQERVKNEEKSGINEEVDNFLNSIGGIGNLFGKPTPPPKPDIVAADVNTAAVAGNAAPPGKSEELRLAEDYIDFMLDFHGKRQLYSQKTMEHDAAGHAKNFENGKVGYLRDPLEKAIQNAKTPEHKERAETILKRVEAMIESNNAKSLEQPSAEYDLPDIMPDPRISVSERDLYGYSDNAMLPLTKDKAVELFGKDNAVYLLYSDNTEAAALDLSDIENHDGIFGIERKDWLISQEYAALSPKNAEGVRESGFIYSPVNAFAIYQLKDGDDLRYHRFESLEGLNKSGLKVDRRNYELTYTAPFSDRIEFLTDRQPVLNRLYDEFNISRPDDYTGRSISVSDVVMLKYNGDFSAHYVDSAGFVEIDAFLGNEKQPEQAAPAVEISCTEYKAPPPIKAEPVTQEPPPVPAAVPEPGPKTFKPTDVDVYRYPPEIARAHGDLDLYRQSLKLNKECAAAIDRAINAEPNREHTINAVKTVIDEYGKDRVNWVLANTVQKQDYDGRLSSDNKTWAKGFDIPATASDFHCNIHPALLNSFINQCRETRHRKPSLMASLDAGERKSKEMFGDKAASQKDIKNADRPEV
jgi:hypothetical protein